MFIYFMAAGSTLRQFLDIFTDDYEKNDAIARTFYNKLVGKGKISRSRNFILSSCLQYCTSGEYKFKNKAMS